MKLVYGHLTAKAGGFKKNLLHATVYIKHFQKLLNYLELSVFYRITNQGIGNIVNKEEYRLHDLRKWLLLVEPYEKKFIYRAMCGRHKMLLFSSINSKSFMLIIAYTKNILLAFLKYTYFSFTYYFYTKKTRPYWAFPV